MRRAFAALVTFLHGMRFREGTLWPMGERE